MSRLQVSEQGGSSSNTSDRPPYLESLFEFRIAGIGIRLKFDLFAFLAFFLLGTAIGLLQRRLGGTQGGIESAAQCESEDRWDIVKDAVSEYEEVQSPSSERGDGDSEAISDGEVPWGIGFYNSYCNPGDGCHCLGPDALRHSDDSLMCPIDTSCRRDLLCIQPEPSNLQGTSAGSILHVSDVFLGAESLSYPFKQSFMFDENCSPQDDIESCSPNHDPDAVRRFFMATCNGCHWHEIKTSGECRDDNNASDRQEDAECPILHREADDTVINGISCLACRSEGLRMVADAVRDTVFLELELSASTIEEIFSLYNECTQPPEATIQSQWIFPCYGSNTEVEPGLDALELDDDR